MWKEKVLVCFVLLINISCMPNKKKIYEGFDLIIVDRYKIENDCRTYLNKIGEKDFEYLLKEHQAIKSKFLSDKGNTGYIDYLEPFDSDHNISSLHKSILTDKGKFNNVLDSAEQNIKKGDNNLPFRYIQAVLRSKYLISNNNYWWYDTPYPYLSISFMESGWLDKELYNSLVEVPYERNDIFESIDLYFDKMEFEVKDDKVWMWYVINPKGIKILIDNLEDWECPEGLIEERTFFKGLLKQGLDDGKYIIVYPSRASYQDYLIS
ncbi:hypothetical protein V6R21_02010 [Limibacter armeniacum]|uniref:hypothetical protein n=1 Tax=Limibacter armeniacum TaxID=466084 RepID=UPI002FE6732B